ncbi:Mediator of replication checkpoint protein 1 [Emericellopsis cladophorae]|uniref:Mediator of replication checkpoint protein 1 n=1 Tax=Emericellopsis cladophorae TaxID=2686198 RepID=A0A9P9Y1N7_9HYPO|nr:Mediator of replication checkpoint protein 1 [Emericellopsis cladophorae]KAI6781681.1 Mediator of replication checkpoint protein 1 [Emericellopsis cladophorae]
MSTRSSSPASDAGSPGPLTPRTKIRNLLDAMGSKGDSQDATYEAQSPSKRPTATASESSAESDSDANSDEEIRPRGRLAARMQAAAAKVSEESPIGSPSQTKTSSRGSPPKDLDQVDDENHSDEDLPVLPRRLHRKTARELTPESAATEGHARSNSPGLFVSSPAQPSPAKSAQLDSDDELPPTKSDRFKALVERKRAEARAREAADEAKKAERRDMQEKLASEISQLESDDGSGSGGLTDDEGGRKLTQENRPSRKASKKAIEDINRETQRMQRSMQLAQEAKTRKKISKSSFLERFNIKPTAALEPKVSSSSRPGSPEGDDVDMENDGTPPSSPPPADAPNEKAREPAAVAPVETLVPGGNQDLPNLASVIASQDKGKGKAVAPSEVAEPAKKKQIRVKLPLPLGQNMAMLDSDDELEIVRPEKDAAAKLASNVVSKSQVPRPLQIVQALGRPTSPQRGDIRKGQSKGMTAGQLQVYLAGKAREQARKERERRMHILKAQGVVIQTAEEREREMQEVEDIVAKARAEAEQIMRQEREEAKKEKKADGNHDPLAWDESDDELYEDVVEDADAELSAMELSGSDGEDEDEEEEQDQEEETEGALIDSAAQQDESEDEELDADEPLEDVTEASSNVRRRARKQTTILSDEEDDVETTPRPKSMTQATPTIPRTATPNAPSSVLRSAKKSFIPGLPVKGPAGLGLTQMFAGTMDDDSQMPPSQDGPTQSMMPDFDTFPDSNFSATIEACTAENTVEPATQREETQAYTQGISLNFASFDSAMQDVPGTQLSEMMEPSQDVGMRHCTPIKQRFFDAPHSTVDTVVPDREESAQQDSPLVRRGRYRRKMDATAPEEDELVPTTGAATPAEGTAFTSLKDAALQDKKRRAAEEFDRKKSKAKEMIDENAEESEDEYQGLGGYDGEDSDDESTASVKDMLDDATGNNTGEREIAAFHADRERANDEQQVEQLFKDVTRGMLRRKRGADYDLSDSDDGGEARRKMKRRQFAKMQKALFADERVKKMAENPGNKAFLKTIEDRDSDDEMDLIGFVEEPAEEDSQSQSQEAAKVVVPDSQPPAALAHATQQDGAPAHPRRTKHGRKATHIGDVRQTLSSLIDDGREGSVVPATDVGSDSDDESRGNKENQNPRQPSGIVDRISLKRDSSSASSTSGSRLAFGASLSSSSFKVPALLRRATTNSFKPAGSTAPATTTSSGFGDDAKIKKAAGKKSGVSSLASARDQSGSRAKVEESERRRELRKAKGAERRVGMVGGLLGRGSFE